MNKLKARFYAHPVGTAIELSCLLILIGYNIASIGLKMYNYRMQQMTLGMCFITFGVTELIINPKKSSKLPSVIFVVLGLINCVLAIFPH